MKKFKKFLQDQRGQTDIIGNVLDLIKTQPWILIIVFLALIYAASSSITVLGVELSIYPTLNALINTVTGAFGFGFDWELFVIFCFLAVIVGFIFKFRR